MHGFSTMLHGVTICSGGRSRDLGISKSDFQTSLCNSVGVESPVLFLHFPSSLMGIKTAPSHPSLLRRIK